ncbi:hypothetical protein LCGC14_0017680 [marine sediment metagenome]|uniref:Uncharacterized protein n=1 Tax=marine sediment metagenome TaxID=412755 RepID=A0A0F9Z2H0_9ZZZZ
MKSFDRSHSFCLLVGLLALLAGMPAGCQRISDKLKDAFKTDRGRFLGPDKPILSPERSRIDPIRTSGSLADVTEEMLRNSEFPVESDYQYSDEDYVIGPNDVLDIGILDLFQPGQETIIRRQVEASGFIDLPLLEERLHAEGLTSQQLRHEVVEAYSPDLLRDPRVNVSVLARRQQTFSMIGSVVSVGTYDLARRDLRLLEALSLARGITNPTIRYIYIIRPLPAIRKSYHDEPAETEATSGLPEERPTGPSEELPSSLPPLPDEGPQTQPMTPEDESPPPMEGPSETPDLHPATSTSATPETLPDLPAVVIPAETAPQPATQPAPAAEPTTGPISVVPPTSSTAALLHYVRGLQVTPATAAADQQYNRRWVFNAGRWVLRDLSDVFVPNLAEMGEGEGTHPAADADQPAGGLTGGDPSKPGESASQPATAPKGDRSSVAGENEPLDEQSDPFDWNRAARSDMARIIAINLAKLYDGDPRMNIIIRPNDIIHVPALEIGEFYIMGEVARPGVYSLTGRRITVKMAIAAAGNFTGIAWPSNSVLFRRIGENQEQTIPLNIEKIFRGQESDIFLKANDVIGVGTHPAASFMAVIRNAFRMTYGFGFIYDRNFADPAIGERSLTHHRFTRW